MIWLLNKLDASSRSTLIVAGLVVLTLIGVVDYLTGFELLFSVFYLLEVGLAAWFVGWGFGLIMSVLSVMVWIGGDVAAGAHYSNLVVPVWNAVILMVFYFIVVWLLTRLRSLHRDLEERVTQRTRALTHEMAERQRLEEEILQVSEREQRDCASQHRAVGPGPATTLRSILYGLASQCICLTQVPLSRASFSTVLATSWPRQALASPHPG